MLKTATPELLFQSTRNRWNSKPIRNETFLISEYYTTVFWVVPSSNLQFASCMNLHVRWNKLIYLRVAANENTQRLQDQQVMYTWHQNLCTKYSNTTERKEMGKNSLDLPGCCHPDVMKFMGAFSISSIFHWLAPWTMTPLCSLTPSMTTCSTTS